MIAVLIITNVLLLLALTACLLERHQASRLDRVAMEELLAVWRMRQIVSDARRQMHEAARQSGRPDAGGRDHIRGSGA